MRKSLCRTLRRHPFGRPGDVSPAIHVGELVTFLASVNYTGRTSIEVGIKVLAENIQTQTARHANSCFFTMVAADSPPVPRC